MNHVQRLLLPEPQGSNSSQQEPFSKILVALPTSNPTPSASSSCLLLLLQNRVFYGYSTFAPLPLHKTTQVAAKKT
jgi:hypothetical protein